MSKTTLFAVLVGLVLVSGVGVIYSKHQSRGLLSEWQELQVKKNELELEWQMLQLEQSTLTAETVIDQAARGRLGLHTPAPDEVVYVTR